jgi:hypothetical protein
MQGIKLRLIALSALMSVPLMVLAGGPSEPTHMPNSPMPKFNFFEPQSSLLKQLRPHKVHHHHRARLHYVTLYPGSLKSNLVRISRAYGWKHIIWTSQDDYHWIGKIRVAANNLPDILGKILKDYPLQADFYDGNHVLVIKPRTIQA